MSGLAARVVFAVLAGFLFSQSAEFTQQYLQRLGGAADELEAIVRRFDEGASREGLSRDAAVARLQATGDRFVSRQGEDAARTILRFEDLSRRYRTLTQASPIARPFVAGADPDIDVMQQTLDDFRPALPLTAQGLVLTLVGFAGGWGAGAAGLARRRRRHGRSGVADDTRRV